MSRLFPERLTVRLAPDSLSVRSDKTLARGKPAEVIGCDPHFGVEPWQGAIAALNALRLDFACKVTVVLANALVRYALVPWSAAVDGAAEEEAFVRHHFLRIHGERARGWAVRVSDDGRPARLACAIDRALLEALERSFAPRRRARLVSVQPQLMHGFNVLRKAVPGSGAWLVLAEPQRACVALHARGAWRAVLNGKGDWLSLLERERLRLGTQAPQLVLLCGALPPEEPGPWTFRALELS